MINPSDFLKMITYIYAFFLGAAVTNQPDTAGRATRAQSLKSKSTGATSDLRGMFKLYLS